MAARRGMCTHVPGSQALRGALHGAMWNMFLLTCLQASNNCKHISANSVSGHKFSVQLLFYCGSRQQ